MLTSLKKGFSILLRLYLLIIFLPSVGEAQTNTENFAQFEFNFNNPGARATGIGGAFISIADDATAAEANPAGLTALIRPEVSFEIKGLQYTQNVHNFSHTGTAADFTLINKNFENSVVSPSFASVVLPFKILTVSAFRHELVNFENSFFTKGTFFGSSPDILQGRRLFPVSSNIDLDVVNWGGAVGIKLHERFSVGVSAGISKINLNSQLNRYWLEVFDESTLANRATIDDTDNDVFVNVGLIFRPTNNIAIGGIYKKRPKFSLQHTFEVLRTDFKETQQVNFNIPSSYGFGISFRPTDVLTFSFDAVRINYSDLTDDFIIVFTPNDVASNDYAVEDGTEFHFGAEWVTFWNSLGIVLRGGFFTDPDNIIRWVGEPVDENDPSFVNRAATDFIFREGDDDFNYTFGLGLILMDNFQVDLAGTLSDRTDAFVASFVLRFK